MTQAPRYFLHFHELRSAIYQATWRNSKTADTGPSYGKKHFRGSIEFLFFSTSRNNDTQKTYWFWQPPILVTSVIREIHLHRWILSKHFLTIFTRFFHVLSDTKHFFAQSFSASKSHFLDMLARKNFTQVPQTRNSWTPRTADRTNILGVRKSSMKKWLFLCFFFFFLERLLAEFILDL